MANPFEENFREYHEKRSSKEELKGLFAVIFIVLGFPLLAGIIVLLIELF